jgi:hypothetical protein
MHLKRKEQSSEPYLVTETGAAIVVPTIATSKRPIDHIVRDI